MIRCVKKGNWGPVKHPKAGDGELLLGSEARASPQGEKQQPLPSQTAMSSSASFALPGATHVF